MEIQPTTEIWEVEANGQRYEGQFEDLTTWISEGSLLRIDRVRKGTLRWIEAGKVPALTEFFNAKDADMPPPPVITTSTTEVLGVAPTPASAHGFTYNEPSATSEHSPFSEFCALHTEAPTAYVCETCSNSFCKECPNSYGGSVKICPFCGAMCRSLAQADEHRTRSIDHSAAIAEGFGFSDFGRAIAHPFKFKTSLFFGAVLFMVFSLGQSASSFGGIFMMAAAIICYMMANMLSFGVLANTVDNFSQGKLNENFMPSFDDFSLWDDVVQPFFLSIGVYIASFGPFIATILIAFFMVLGAVQQELDPFKADAARSLNPDVPYAVNATKQSQQINSLIDRTKQTQQQRLEALERDDESPVSANANTPGADEEEYFRKMNETIQQHRKAQLESTFGKTAETREKEQQALFSKILGYGAIFLLLAGITLLWGLFYFPAACAVAAYTRSFAATINPSVGFDTIKRLGGSYFLILLMGLFLLIASVIVSGFVSAVFMAFDLPGVGNLPAKAIGSMFGFYLWVVFSCLLGYALYKASDRLQLVR